MPTIGTCNLCGGPVQTPDLWAGTQPPQPECAHCHAIPVTPYGPIIPMQLKRYPWPTTAAYPTPVHDPNT